MKNFINILAITFCSAIGLLPIFSLAQDDEDLTKRIIRIQLYTEASYNAASTSSDAIRIEFTDDGDNEMDDRDVIKFTNLDENLARFYNSTLLTIENRAQPINGELLSLFINQYTTSSYVLLFDNDNFEDKVLKLVDTYLNEDFVIDEENLVHQFTVDNSVNASTFYGRFKLLIEDEPLSNVNFENPEFSISPNPVKGDLLNIQSSFFAKQKVEISLYNQVGKRIMKKTVQFPSSGNFSLTNLNYNAGVYLLQLKTNQQQITKKLIKL